MQTVAGLFFLAVGGAAFIVAVLADRKAGGWRGGRPQPTESHVAARFGVAIALLLAAAALLGWL